MTTSLMALSPYLYHRFDLRQLRKNIGDGFILRAIERHVGAFDPRNIFSSRHPPTVLNRNKLEQARAVIIAGANQLQDDFAPWPGLTPTQLRNNRYRFIPFGVGLSGKPGGGTHFTDAAIENLHIIHERIEYSSWRCPRTVAVLEKAMPSLTGRFLMTGCPVVLDRPLLDGNQFQADDKTIAVTITDRHKFWDREAPVLVRVAQRFAKSRRLLVIHQDTVPVRGTGLMLDRLGIAAKRFGEKVGIRHLARTLGYEIVVPKTADEGIALYRDVVDMHFGSRLHAHLLMLSRNKRSFLVSVDERMAGMAEFFQFPLCDPLEVDEHLNFNFEIVRTQARLAAATMATFVKSIQAAT